MEIDHYDPNLKGRSRNLYRNLYLAVSQCNNHKRHYWPTAAERRLGIRFLDPCAENDYAEHIWEDPISHELVSTSPAGRYHIDCCDLNNPTFIDERKTRTALRRSWRDGELHKLSGDWDDLGKYLALTKDILDAMIPDIPPPPDGAKLY